MLLCIGLLKFTPPAAKIIDQIEFTCNVARSCYLYQFEQSQLGVYLYTAGFELLGVEEGRIGTRLSAFELSFLSRLLKTIYRHRPPEFSSDAGAEPATSLITELLLRVSRSQAQKRGARHECLNDRLNRLAQRKATMADPMGAQSEREGISCHVAVRILEMVGWLPSSCVQCHNWVHWNARSLAGYFA